MSNCSFDGIQYANIFQNVTIVPRLDYSNGLLCGIIGILKKKRSEIKKSNKFILKECNFDDKNCQKALNIEKTISFSIEILSQIQKRTGMISGYY